jgi:His/Glu/Gln/Arg/opine family amino acid ABC transporter permease subunit
MLRLLLLGACYTLGLAVAGITCGTVLGLVLTPLGFLRFWPLRAFYHLYVFFTRGTPLLVLALLIFYGLPAFNFSQGPYVAGTIVLTVYSSAFFAEVFRGGVLAIQRTHVESARSLGLPPLAFLRKIIAPLALRYALPPYVNVCVMMVKASSILSIISVWELTLAAREIIERTLLVFTVLGIAAGLYFIMCFGVDRLGRQAERYLMRRGFVGEHA